MKKLFLHYGPGATAEIEKHWLGQQLPDVDFWNQPKVKAAKKPFAELVDLSHQQALKEGTPCNLIGHSFGADLICALVGEKQLNINKAILVSPLMSIPKAMLRLADVLAAKQPVPALNAAISNAKAKMSPETFWALIVQVGSHPGYLPSFWQRPEALQRFINLAAKAQPFDGGEWQAVIQEFLFSGTTGSWTKIKQIPVLAIFGEQDPYFDKATDLPFWKHLLGEDRVMIIKNSGHFPHLEDDPSFIRACNEWFD